MKQLLTVCFILGELITSSSAPSGFFLFPKSGGVKKEIRLKGTFKRISTKSLTLSPIEACVNSSSLDVIFLEELGNIDVILYAESGSIIYSEIINTSVQQYLSIDVSDWDSGIYEIRFVNSDGKYMYGTFEIGL